MGCSHRKDLFCWQCSESEPCAIPPAAWCQHCKNIVSNKASTSRSLIQKIISNKEKYTEREVLLAENMLWLIYDASQKTEALMDSYRNLLDGYVYAVKRSEELHQQLFELRRDKDESGDRAMDSKQRRAG